MSEYDSYLFFFTNSQFTQKNMHFFLSGAVKVQVFAISHCEIANDLWISSSTVHITIKIIFKNGANLCTQENKLKKNPNSINTQKPAEINTSKTVPSGHCASVKLYCAKKAKATC